MMSADAHPLELLAPAGDIVCLQAALHAGADAVYLGLDGFNMRARSGVNFTCETLPEASRLCRAQGVKLYLTLNSIIFEGELATVEETIVFAQPYVDAFIVADWGVVALCQKHHAPFHVSTQMSCSNSLAAQFLRAQGATRVVLARECALAEVSEIARTSGLEIEVFVHGAQCIAESGRCFLSHDAYGCSANRGACHQPCRRRFLIKAVDRYTDKDGNPIHDADAEFEVTPHTVLSAKDLCSLPFLDQLVAAGVTSFKIEGRARKPEYVHAVVSAYRTALDAIRAGTYTPELAAQLVEQTKTVFHREMTCGMFYGRPGVDQYTDQEDSLATTVKVFVGPVLDYFLKAGIVQVQVQDAELHMGDHIQVHGPTTGVVETTITSLHRDADVLAVAERGTWVTFPCPRARVNDKVFLMKPRESPSPNLG